MTTHTKRFSIITLILALLVPMINAQHVAVKTNVLSDVMTNINVGAEAVVAPKWTVALNGEVNPWKFSGDTRLKHISGNAAMRYWLCDAFNGHFFGAGVQGGQYNIGGIKGLPDMFGTKFSKLADQRYQGWYAGIGVSYGYDWIINRHWNIEAVIGAGWNYSRYDAYPCASCGTKTESNARHNYLGVTEAAINLVYIF